MQYIYVYQFYLPIKSLRHIRPCINKIAIKLSNELMKNIIVKEGGSVERLLSSEVFMARMIFIKLHFGNKMKT